MVRTQIYLTEEQKRVLEKISARAGKTAAALIREAIDAYLRERGDDGNAEALEASFGLWTDRRLTGDSYARSLRQEWDARTSAISESP